MRATPYIRKIGSQVLWTPSVDVPEKDFGKLKTVDKQMRYLMKHVNGHGIAAPQIGVNKRVFCSGINGYKLLVNPQILETSGLVTMREGCLSIPDLWVEIERPKDVFLTAVTPDGTLVEIEATGLEARLFQHELDHLSGLTYFDRLKPEQVEDLKSHKLFRQRPAPLV